MMEAWQVLSRVALSVNCAGILLFVAGFSSPYWTTTETESHRTTRGLWRVCTRYHNISVPECVPPDEATSYAEAVQVMESLALMIIVSVLLLSLFEVVYKTSYFVALNIILNSAIVSLGLTGVAVWVSECPGSTDIGVYLTFSSLIVFFVAGFINVGEYHAAKKKDDESRALLDAATSPPSPSSSPSGDPTKSKQFGLDYFMLDR